MKDAALAGFWRLRNLLTLQLRNCTTLTSACLSHIGKLSLTHLSLTGCTGMTTSLPVQHLPSSLTHLDVGGVPGMDSGACDLMLQHLPELRELVAWNTRVDNTGVQMLGFLPGLRALDVSWTAVSFLPLLASLTRLEAQRLTLEGILHAGDDPSAGGPGAAPILCALNLSHCTLTGSTPHELTAALHDLAPGLRSMQLAGTPTLSDVSFLSRCTGLEQLTIDGPRPPSSLTHMAASTALRQLSVHGVNLSDDINLLFLLSLSQLQSLELVECHLDDTCLSYVWSVGSHLTRLVLDSNPQLTGAPPSTSDLDSAPAPPVQRASPAQPASYEGDIWAVPRTGEVMQHTRRNRARAPDSDSAVDDGWGRLRALRHFSCVGTGITDTSLADMVQPRSAGGGAGEAALGRLAALTSLRLGSDALGDAGLKALVTSAVGAQLEALELVGCSQVSSRGVLQLCRCPRLCDVVLTGCRLVRSDAVAQPLLVQGPSLRTVRVEHTTYTAPAPAQDDPRGGGRGSAGGSTGRTSAPTTPLSRGSAPVSASPAGLASASAGKRLSAGSARAHAITAAVVQDQRIRYEPQDLLTLSGCGGEGEGSDARPPVRRDGSDLGADVTGLLAELGIYRTDGAHTEK